MDELADNFINGVPSVAHAFVRAGGYVSAMLFVTDNDLLSWMWGMLKGIYTRAILPAELPRTASFPLNPFTVIQSQLDRVCMALLA